MALSTIPNNMQAALTGSNLPAGAVLQVKQGLMDGYLHSSGSSYINLSDMNVTITPTSANSKMLCTMQISISATDRYHITKLFRSIGGGSDVQVAKGNPGSSTNRHLGWMALGTGNRHEAGAGWDTYEQHTTTGMFLDSPNTTSAIVYKPYVGVYAGHAYTINSSHYNSGAGNDNWQSAPISNFVVMEIAG